MRDNMSDVTKLSYERVGKEGRLKNIDEFANKYIDFFEKEFGRTRESYYRFFDSNDFPEECRALGFEMDCGHSFNEVYGDAWNDVKVLKAKMDEIRDIQVVGNGLFSQWRYFNHWSSPSYANDDTKEWFLLLFCKLKALYQQKETRQKRTTPEKIDRLNYNEIFVFGSNLQGMHKGGAAYAAYRKFGAIMGQGVGLQGQSYAIPTMQGGVETIRPYVDEFIEFAKQHTELTFLVTRIGCGIAGFTDEEISPLFKEAHGVENIVLPPNW